MYTQAGVKRQKTKDRTDENNEYFPGVQRVEYRPDGPNDDLLRYRYYNATERLQGRSMEDWLRPTLCLSRGFSQNSKNVIKPWAQCAQSMDSYKRSIRAAFELCMKLGIKWWSSSDRDLYPEGDSAEETQQYIDEISEYIYELQQKTLLKPLWLTADLNTNKRYLNGSCTSSEILIINYAGYQVKKIMDIGQKLGADCFLFSGEHNHQNTLNSELSRDVKHYAQFLKLIVEYKERMNYRNQLLIDCTKKYETPKKSAGSEINFQDPLKMLCFLRHFNLEKNYKINFSPNQDYYLLSSLGTLGSIDVTDPTISMSNIIMLMRYVVQQGGITPGGLNLRLPLTNGLYEPKDLAESYVTYLDMYAKALRIAIKMVNDAHINRSIQSRYVTFSSGWGAHFENSAATLEECEDQIKKNYDATCLKIPPSVRSEHWQSLLTQTSEVFTK